MEYTKIGVCWQVSTFLLYISVIMVSLLASSEVLFKNICLRIHRHSVLMMQIQLLAVSLLLVLFKGFCVSGRDIRVGYYLNYKSATSFGNYRDNTVEIGYRTLMIIVRTLFGAGSYPFFLFITSALTVLPVMFLIYKHRNEIHVPTAVMMYASIFYYPGFSLNRIYLASSIGLLAFEAIVEKKVWKSALLILLAISIHTSSFILFLPFFLIFFEKIGKRISGICLLAMIVLVYLKRDQITEILGESSRYHVYSISKEVHIGLEQFIYYIPLIVLYVMNYKKTRLNLFWILFQKQKDKNYTFLVYLLIGLAFGILSYIVPILGRMQAMFTPFVIIVPYYLKPMMKTKMSWLVMHCVIVAYCLARFYIFISQYYELDDLMPYITFWGARI